MMNRRTFLGQMAASALVPAVGRTAESRIERLGLQLYTVRTLDPSLTKIDADVDVLVLVHPKELSPAALYAIDQYALRGGHVLALTSDDDDARAFVAQCFCGGQAQSRRAADDHKHFVGETIHGALITHAGS